MHARVRDLARILRVLGDALVDAEQQGIAVDALAAVNLVCDACHAWMVGGDHPLTPVLGPADARLAQHVAHYAARASRE